MKAVKITHKDGSLSFATEGIGVIKNKSEAAKIDPIQVDSVEELLKLDKKADKKPDKKEK